MLWLEGKLTSNQAELGSSQFGGRRVLVTGSGGRAGLLAAGLGRRGGLSRGIAVHLALYWSHTVMIDGRWIIVMLERV
jgi:hypothetical protein